MDKTSICFNVLEAKNIIKQNVNENYGAVIRHLLFNFVSYEFIELGSQTYIIITD